MFKGNWIGIQELKAAIARNPQNVLNHARIFLVRGLKEYKEVVIRNPWQMGSSGGGAPVQSGNLRDTHQTKIDGLRGTFGPNLSVAKYAAYVHGIEGMPRKRSYQLRPWLDYAKMTAEHKVEKHYRQMLKDIVGELAK